MTEPNRWEALFADLEGELAAADKADLLAEVADRTRREHGQLRFVDRLRAALGQEVCAQIAGAGAASGRLAEVGPDWILLAEGFGREALVPLRSVNAVAGLGARSAYPGSEGELAARLDLRHALRRLVRDRTAISMVLTDGQTLSGTLDRVGADFVEVAEHPPGEPRRANGINQVRAVPLRALGLVRSGA